MSTNSLELCNEALARIGAEAITSLTADAKVTDRMCNIFYAVERDRLLKKFTWNFAKKATPLVRTDLFDTSDDYKDTVTITNIATSNPVVVTGTNSFSAGQTILIEDISGTTELNDLIFEIAAANSATFSLLGVDGGKYTAYSSGGTAIRKEAMTAYYDGYTYDIPSDCLRPIALDSGANFEIIETRLVTADDAATLIYTKAVTDTTLFSKEFDECLVAKLSVMLCMPVWGAISGAKMLPTMEGIYRQALKEAEKVNVNSVKKSYEYTDPWVSVRL